MATKRSKKDFIGFILDAEENKKLAREFLSQVDANKLSDFFKNKKYEIDDESCKAIWEAKERLEKVTIGDILTEGPCPPNVKY